jgi:hypothetical protein
VAITHAAARGGPQERFSGLRSPAVAANACRRLSVKRNAEAIAARARASVKWTKRLMRDTETLALGIGEEIGFAVRLKSLEAREAFAAS